MKLKILKNTKIEYDGKEYTNILYLNRSYDYCSFTYLEDDGTEITINPQQNKEFNVITIKS